jgi:hypothetical protein
MKPLNAEERKRSFLKFLGLFVITTLLIVTAVYFGYKVPFKQNEELKERIAIVEKEKTFADDFSARMKETKVLLDSVMLPGVQSELVDGHISENLKKMNAMTDAQPAGSQEIYRNIVRNFADLQIAKKQLREVSGKDATVGECQQKLAQANADLQQCHASESALRMQLMSIQQKPQ